MLLKITTISPVHISSGNEYELYFNLIIHNNKAYLYDEFKIAQFFIKNNILIPRRVEELKKLIEKEKIKIINSNLHHREVETNFLTFNKPLLEQISTQNNPILPGSSIKGAIETAIFNLLVTNSERVKDIKNNLINSQITKERFINHKGQTKHTIDRDFSNIFKFLKISDSYNKLKTKIYKTINMKRNKENQHHRENKVKHIANYVEAIQPLEEFEISIKDTSSNNIFKKIGDICNGYYIPKINEDIKYYFYKKGSLPIHLLKNLNKKKFILNVGRFGGAEKKSIKDFRYIKNSHCDDKSKTSAITFALENSCNDEIYYENCLYPFGWILCEIKE